MIPDAIHFPYQPGGDIRVDGALPYLPIRLQNQEHSIERLALVDSGATVNVLPYSAGMRLGAIWDRQLVELSLGGNLAAVPARGLLLTATIAHLPPVRLAFAWAYSDDVPLVLGQMNFFQEYEVCFFQGEGEFAICPRRDG